MMNTALIVLIIVGAIAAWYGWREAYLSRRWIRETNRQRAGHAAQSAHRKREFRSERDANRALAGK